MREREMGYIHRHSIIVTGLHKSRILLGLRIHDKVSFRLLSSYVVVVHIPFVGNTVFVIKRYKIILIGFSDIKIKE